MSSYESLPVDDSTQDDTLAQLARDFRDLFVVDPRGRRVMMHLVARFNHGTAAPGAGLDGIGAALQTYRFNGQREVIDEIEKQIAIADQNLSMAIGAAIGEG